MKDCQKTRTQLSAYVDGELTPAQRAKIDAHLALCPDCQQEVAELKTLGVGLAALPQLRPAPRFLAEVRRKIAHGDNPEALTWGDHLFRPFWLKVPLELAAIIAIVGYVMRSGEPMPVRWGAGTEMAKNENSPSERESAEMAAKPEPSDKPEPAPGEPARTPTASDGASQESPPAEPMPSPVAQVPADNQPGPSGVSRRQLLYVPPKDEEAAGLATDNLKLQDRRRAVTFAGSPGGFALGGTTSAVPNSTALAATLGIEPSKVRGVVTVNNRKMSDVRIRAELLAAKCNGRVFPIPQSKDATGQVFFVEVPREYVAEFRSELLQEPLPPGVTNEVDIHAESGSATETVVASAITGHAEGGVLVGRPETNEDFKAYSGLNLAHDAKTPGSSTVVLEIVVVPPPN